MRFAFRLKSNVFHVYATLSRSNTNHINFDIGIFDEWPKDECT